MDRAMSISKLTAQFNRTRISLGDFTEAEDYLSANHAEQSTTVKRALLVAAIVAYARPFIGNNGGSDDRATPLLQARISKIFTTPSELSLHETLISLRHQALAHSQYERKAVVAPAVQTVASPFRGQTSTFCQSLSIVPCFYRCAQR